MKTVTTAEREAAGRAARERTKRSSHRQLGQLARDPLELLMIGTEGLVPKLVPLRHGRMLASPFAFFVGSPILQAHDLSVAPNTGMVIPVCGDAHLLNFGAFATPERQLVFDIKDFDEVSPAPWEWDLKRLATSFVLAARQMRYSRGAAETLVMSAVGEYRDRMRQYAESGALELWYEKSTFDRMIETALTPEARRLIRRGMEKAASRTQESALDKLAQYDGGQWTIRDAPLSTFHVPPANTLFEPDDAWFDVGHWRQQIVKLYEGYRKTLSHDRRELLGHFDVQDLAFRMVGADVGARRLMLLAVDHRGEPLFLQIKDARRSAIARFFRAPVLKHEGERIVEGQRLMQAAGDILAGWSTAPSGRHVYVRQLRDMKLSAHIELLDSALLADYARLCGWSLARAHARAGNAAIEIAAYIGRGDPFAEALAGYAFAYADQVERDYEVFANAVRHGVLPVCSEGDIAADLGL